MPVKKITKIYQKWINIDFIGNIELIQNFEILHAHMHVKKSCQRPPLEVTSISKSHFRTLQCHDDDDDDVETARSRASDPALTHIVITCQWVLHSSSNMDPRTALVIYRWAQTFAFSTPWHWVSTYYAPSQTTYVSHTPEPWKRATLPVTSWMTQSRRNRTVRNKRPRRHRTPYPKTNSIFSGERF